MENIAAAIEDLKQLLLSLCALVEENLSDAMESAVSVDTKLAHKVIYTDTVIDRKEVEVEEFCVRDLALHQPVAKDLRFLVAVLKINNDLERIGDMSVHIAERALSLANLPRNEFPEVLSRMARTVKTMLKTSVDALVELNLNKAVRATEMDDSVDEIYEEFFNSILEHMKSHPDKIEVDMDYLWISKQLERIADHSTNICEDVIYLIEGDIVRHPQAALESDK